MGRRGGGDFGLWERERGIRARLRRARILIEVPLAEKFAQPAIRSLLVPILTDILVGYIRLMWMLGTFWIQKTQKTFPYHGDQVLIEQIITTSSQSFCKLLHRLQVWSTQLANRLTQRLCIDSSSVS